MSVSSHKKYCEFSGYLSMIRGDFILTAARTTTAGHTPTPTYNMVSRHLYLKHESWSMWVQRLGIYCIKDFIAGNTTAPCSMFIIHLYRDYNRHTTYEYRGWVYILQLATTAVWTDWGGQHNTWLVIYDFHVFEAFHTLGYSQKVEVKWLQELS